MLACAGAAAKQTSAAAAFMSLSRVPLLVLVCVSLGTLELSCSGRGQAYVAILAGQRARPLNGAFNNVPVLHSNQPEIVTGPGILVNTAPGSAIASENNRPLSNATYTFNGAFGVHMHHKYYPSDASKLGGSRSRGLLTLALIASNPGQKSVTLNFKQGSVKNSFEAPYHSNRLMGVKPLGKRPWNTGPGDATAVQLLRNELDRKVPDSVTIPAGGRVVVVRTVLPARGIANGLLQGQSDGPFTMAVVASEETSSDQKLFSVLDQGRLAPGRIYLNRIREIQLGRVFSRVAGVALGDQYRASINHDLTQGALHIPLTSTSRHHFGTRDIQVNPLAVRMIDSALNNIGTYGVRYTVTMNLSGNGNYQLVMSHPVVSGKKPFTAFRGSMQIEQKNRLQEIHVGLRSGESLALADVNLSQGQNTSVKVILVYPADATPGHLLSVVPVDQLALLHRRQLQQQAAQQGIQKNNTLVAPKTPPPLPDIQKKVPVKPVLSVQPSGISPKPSSNFTRPADRTQNVEPTNDPRYTDAIRTQQQWLHQLQGR
ncbi:MAG: hypothetical protein CL864_04265 [Cyanobium sp. SAT1300]|nr:hypothetical protein [Cyanobium sp. SAT1300]